MLVRNQVRIGPSGDAVDLDHGAVLDDIKLYVEPEQVKEAFEFILLCFDIERESLPNELPNS